MSEQHIVDFGSFCRKCLHWTKSEHEEPCNSCLNEPVNDNSKKPVNFVPASDEKRGLSMWALYFVLGFVGAIVLLVGAMYVFALGVNEGKKRKAAEMEANKSEVK